MRLKNYRAWYRKLIGLYPLAYQEKFGASMLQTFDDLCRERASARGGMPGFLLRTFADTLVGAAKEQALSPAAMTTTAERMITIAFMLFWIVAGLCMMAFPLFWYAILRSLQYGYVLRLHVFFLLAIASLLTLLLQIPLIRGGQKKRLAIACMIALALTGTVEARASLEEWRARHAYGAECAAGTQMNIARRWPFNGIGMLCANGRWSVDD